MALDFPSAPVDGQVFGSYVWLASKGVWQSREESAAVAVTSPTAPTSANNGDLWYNTERGIAYIYYDDGTSAQWVEVVTSGTPELSTKANLAGGNTFSGTQVFETPIAISSGGTGSSTIIDAQNNLQIPLSTNYIINAAFDIWQRATSTTTTAAAYRTADRWATWIDSGSGTIQRDTTNVPEFIQYGIRYTSSGASGSCIFYHTIETLNAELLAGKTINLSAYLSGTAGKSIQVSLWSSTTTDNAFSGSWTLVGATVYSNTTSVSRVSASYTVPSNAKTIQVRVYNLDKLANTEFVSFTGVQLEEGSVATSFRRNANSISGELNNCLRYFNRYSFAAGDLKPFITKLSPTGSGAGYGLLLLPVPMRVAPTTTFSAASTFQTHVPGIVINSPTGISALTVDASPKSIQISTSGSSGFTFGQAVDLQWNSSGGGFIEISAEL